MSGRFTRGELGLVGTAALLVFSRVFGLSLVLPNFRGHYEVWGVDPFWIGVAFSAYGLTMALMQFPSGILSDRFGRRPLLWIASAFFIGGSILSAFAPNIPTLIAGRLLQGTGAVASVAVAAVGETLPPQRRTMGMALVGIPAGLGFLAGMAFGPLLYPALAMQGLFLLTAAVGVVAALPLLRVSMPAPATRVAPRPLTPTVGALALGGFAVNYIMTTTLFFLPEGTTQRLPILLLAGFVSMMTLSRVIDKRGWTWQPLVVAATGIGVASYLFVRIPGAGYWAGGLLFFLFHSILVTVLPSQVSRVAGPSGGRGHGLQNVIAYGGTFLAGPLAGLLAGNPGIAVGVAIAVCIAAALAIGSTMRMPQASNTTQPRPDAEP